MSQMTLDDERSAVDHAGYVESLKKHIQPLALELLERATYHGVSVDEVRHAAETRGWLTGEESGRTLSFLAGVMRACGAVATDYKPSTHRKSKNRPVRVWVLEKYLDARK